MSGVDPFNCFIGIELMVRQNVWFVTKITYNKHSSQVAVEDPVRSKIVLVVVLMVWKRLSSGFWF